MQNRTNKHHHDTLKTAIQWFVALQSEQCSEEQKQAFQVWLSSAPKNAEYYTEAEKLWSQMDSLKSAKIPSLKLARRANHKNRLGKSLVRYSSLAVMILVSGLIWQDYQSPTEYIATGIGEYKQLELADKSKLILNAGTRLQVHVSWLRREVMFLEGEAQFNVTHQALRPFTVKTGNLKITDIGTIFNIRNRPEHKSIAVLEGEVGIAQDGKWRSVSLQAGFSRGFTANGSLLPTEKIDADNANAWIRKRLNFKHTPLSEVAMELERHHPVHFVFKDVRIGKQTISGNFDNQDLNSFLESIEQIYPINIVRKKQTLELSSHH